MLGDELSNLRIALSKRGSGFPASDAVALAEKARELRAAVMEPDIKNPDGMIAIERHHDQNAWQVLGYDIGWRAAS